MIMEEASTPAMKVSIIMPAFNEERNIGRALQTLVEQTISIKSFEVLVIDNGSRDNTAAIARSFEDRLHMRVFTMYGGTIAKLRNDAAQLAHGDVLVFLDADCFPKPNWLEKALAERPTSGVWGADYLVPLDGTWVGVVWEEFQAKMHEGDTRFVPGGNLFISHADFDKLGGFHHTLETSEDVDLCSRARKSGMRVVAISALGVYHEGTPRTLAHFYRKNRWHGKHVLRMFLDNLPQTRYLPVVALSIYTLVMFAATILLLLLVFIPHHWLLAAIAACLLLLPAILLSLSKTLPRGRLAAAPALFVLYLTYLLSRANSLIHMPVRSSR